MFDLDPTAGLAGALALSAAAYVTVRRVRVARARKAAPERVRGQLASSVALPRGRREPLAPAPLPSHDRPRVEARRVVATGRPRTPRPGAGGPGASASAEIISLVGTMQWDRALAALRRFAATGADLSAITPIAEALALERMRALPESEARARLGGYRVLAALVPATYAAKLRDFTTAIAARRDELLARLTCDADRHEAGTVWLNHPYNPRFDDVRLPVWLYLGCRAGEAPRLRLRTNWLGDTRISTQGIDVIHDGMVESLTRGAYKIDADALGWEWRDEPADLYQVEVLRSLVTAREVRLRYHGDPWSLEVELRPDEQRSVAEILELYELLRLEAAPAPQTAAA